jgi:hypothetical protein
MIDYQFAEQKTVTPFGLERFVGSIMAISHGLPMNAIINKCIYSFLNNSHIRSIGNCFINSSQRQFMISKSLYPVSIIEFIQLQNILFLHSNYLPNLKYNLFFISIVFYCQIYLW